MVKTDDKAKRAERFICKLYKVPDSIKDTDEARSVLFKKATKPEVLPPTSDGLKFYILRAHLSGTDMEDGTHSNAHFTCTRSV